MANRISVFTGVGLTKLSGEDNARTGSSALAEYIGNLADCQAKRTSLIALGAVETRIESRGDGYYTLHAMFPFGFNGEVTNYPDVPSIHELDTCVAQTIIYASPKVRTYLTATQIGIVRRIVDKYRAQMWTPNGTDTAESLAEAALIAEFTTDNTHVGGRTLTQAKADGISLFRTSAYNGCDDFTEYYSVYRRTLTAATPLQVRAAYIGVGKIWTSAEVKAYEGIAVDGWFQLDTSAQWLKSRPQVLAATGQKTQVVYTYTECRYAAGMIYDAYGSATLIYAPAA